MQDVQCPGESKLAYDGPSCGYVGAILDKFKAMLGHLRAMMGHLEAMSGYAVFFFVRMLSSTKVLQVGMSFNINLA